MSCPQAERTMGLALGEVPEAARALALHHLEICTECAASFSNISRGSPSAELGPPTVELTGSKAEDAGLAETRDEGEVVPITRPSVFPRGSSLGRYVVLELLGQGGMGEVYSAIDPELGRKVAIKLVRAHPQAGRSESDGQARLLREARAMALLSHPNVVPIYDAGTVEGRVFLAMELVEGQSLKRWLQEAPRSWRDVVALFIQAGRGLAAAHQVGLVHRDFKPQNVVIGADGRARVLDFGLARAGAEPEGAPEVPGIPRAASLMLEESDSRHAMSASITCAGAVVGTPGYMAPEQFQRRPFDARTDQFSFCVALYEALYREKPFEGRTFEALSKSVTAGVLRPEPKNVRVPVWLRKIVLRGLSVEPDARFASMDALLDALSRDPAIARRRWLGMGAGALLVASLLVGAGLYREGRQQLCRGSAAKLAGVWDEAMKASVRKAFMATGVPFAADASRALERSLDPYAASWVQQHTEACEATRFRGEQTEAVLTLRMSCLHDRLKELRALASALGEADAKTVEGAGEAASVLGSLSQCENGASLLSRAPLPNDEPSRAKVERAKDLVSSSRALRAAGKPIPGLKLAREAVEEAKASGYVPIQAQATMLLMDFLGDAHDLEAARGAAFDAHQLAEATMDDEIRFASLVSLIEGSVYRPNAFEEGRSFGRLAEGILQRLPNPRASEARLLRRLGMLSHASGQREEAVAQFTRGLELVRDAHDSMEETHLRRDLGNLYYDMGKLQEALEQHQESLRVHREELGHQHPFVAYDLNNLANVYNDLKLFPQAIEALTAAVEIKEKLLGPEHPSLGTSLMNLGDSYREAGRLDLAEPNLTRGLRIYQKADYRELPWGLFAMGRLREAQGRLAESLELYREGYDKSVKKGPGGEPDQFGTLLGMGRVHWKSRKPSLANDALTRAKALGEADPSSDPAELFEVSFLLAQVRWALGDQAGALALAERAAASLEGAHTDVSEQRAEVQAWLRRRSSGAPTGH